MSSANNGPLSHADGAWLNRLPNRWDVVRLKFAVRVRSVKRNVVPKDRYIGLEHVESWTGRLQNSEDASANAEGLGVVFEAGDVLFGKLRPYLAKVFLADRPGIASTEFLALQGVRVEAGFLRYCFVSEPFIGAIVAATYGAKMPRANWEDIGNLPQVVPPRQEQRAIADFLDRETAKIDALIATQERLIALLDEKRQATITHAVTKGLDPNAPMKESGVPSLGRVRASWPVVRLKAILRQVEQGWSPQCENRTAEPDEWGVLKVGCVNGTRFDETENKALPRDLDPIPSLEVKPGDVLMSRANTIELVGSVSLVTAVRHRLLLCDKLYRLHIERHRVDPRFIVYLLTSSVGRAPLEASATGASSSMKNISQESVKDIWLPCPTIEEQGAVADFLDELSGQISAAQRTAKALSEELRERRTALITAAVTGQIDVTRSAVAEAAK